MKSRSILGATILALAVLLISASAAQAAQRDGRQMRRHVRPRRQMMLQQMHRPLVLSVWSLPYLEDELSITPKQRERLNELNERFTDQVYEMIERYYEHPDADIPRFQMALDRLNHRVDFHARDMLNPPQRIAVRKYLWSTFSRSAWDEGGVSLGFGVPCYFVGPWSQGSEEMRHRRMGRGHRIQQGRRHREHEGALPQ